MDHKKVGILTMFHNSKNYGGCLQAYALVRYLKNRGIDAEQIKYQKTTGAVANLERISSLSWSELTEKILRRAKQIWARRARCADFSEALLAKRADAFAMFREQQVPSSAEVYKDADISKVVPMYDAVVVGSDQVWNEVTATSPYLLGFVPDHKLKLSYAASVAQDELSEYAKRTFADALKDFDAVSVREEATADQLSKLIDRKVHWSVDPTFLLSKEEWNAVCQPIDVQGPYLFCYFLGENQWERSLARDYANAHRLRIVTLPYLQGVARKCDEHFGDEQLWDVSPFQFLTLIKNAQCVFTDSFHTCVFSGILQKQFWAFKRAEGRTNSRLVSLLKLFGVEERYLKDEAQCCLAYIEKAAQIDYTEPPVLLKERIAESKRYLDENLIEPLSE